MYIYNISTHVYMYIVIYNNLGFYIYKVRCIYTYIPAKDKIKIYLKKLCFYVFFQYPGFFKDLIRDP